MDFKRVITFGCSFSDYMWKVDTPYGKQLANHFRCEYIHEGCGSGSNARIFRKFFNYIREGLINEETLVTLQFTEIGRDEMWINTIEGSCIHGYDGGMDMVEIFDDGGIYKYKWNSYEWNDNKSVVKLMKDKTDYCYSYEFYKQQSKNMIYSIIEICKYKKIPFIVLRGNYSNGYEDFSLFGDIPIVDYEDIRLKYPTKMRNSDEDDYSHISQEGMNHLFYKILNKIEDGF